MYNLNKKWGKKSETNIHNALVWCSVIFFTTFRREEIIHFSALEETRKMLHVKTKASVSLFSVYWLHGMIFMTLYRVCLLYEEAQALQKLKNNKVHWISSERTMGKNDFLSNDISNIQSYLIHEKNGNKWITLWWYLLWFCTWCFFHPYQ